MVTLSRLECPQLAVVAVPAVLVALSQGSRAGQCGATGTRHPRGTSDSMATHDRVLGFLTQRHWWHWVALSPWWPWLSVAAAMARTRL